MRNCVTENVLPSQLNICDSNNARSASKWLDNDPLAMNRVKNTICIAAVCTTVVAVVGRGYRGCYGPARRYLEQTRYGKVIAVYRLLGRSPGR